MFSRVARELLNLAMTLGGVGLVLITLTDQILKTAIMISIASLTAHLLGVLIDYRADKKNGS